MAPARSRTWPGTVSLSRATLKRVIVEVIGSLARHGFRRFVLANYQADPAHVQATAVLWGRSGGGGGVENGGSVN